MKPFFYSLATATDVSVSARKRLNAAPNFEPEDSVQNYEQAGGNINWKKRLALCWEHEQK